MDRIDKLIDKVKPKLSELERLYIDNPYLSMSLDELLNMMLPDGGQPELHTYEHDQFSLAILEAFRNDEERQRKRAERLKSSAAHVADQPEPVTQPAPEPKEDDPMEAFNKIYYPGGNDND